MPIVSILIPTYNREKFIKQTIECALAQTIQDIEVILVDNCSTDSTITIAQEIAKTDSRLKIFKNEENVGPVKNWQVCAGLANSPYSKILFSDDLIKPNFLERTLPPILNSECAFSYTPGIVGWTPWIGGTHYRAFSGDCKITRDYYARASTYLEHFFPYSPAAALFRTSDLKKHIFSSLPGVEDYDFNKYGAGVDWLIYMLTALNYQHIAYIDEPLVFFRAHDESITIKNESNMIPLGYDLAKKWLKSIVNGL